MDACAIPFPSDSISLFISVVAVIISWFAIVRANKGASASSLIAIYEAFRDSWTRFIEASDDDRRSHEFAELLNWIELACALDADKAFTGKPRELLREYLSDVFGIIYGNDFAKSKLEELSHSPTTFKYLKRFKKKIDRRALPIWKRFSPAFVRKRNIKAKPSTNHTPEQRG